jgi:hypothetical protein
VCRIEDDAEALDVLEWAATAMLRAGLAQAAPKKPPAPRPGPSRRSPRT